MPKYGPWREAHGAITGIDAGNLQAGERQHHAARLDFGVLQKRDHDPVGVPNCVEV